MSYGDGPMSPPGLPTPTTLIPLARFQAVVFDFDGVIVDTEGAIYEAWRELFESHGADLPLDLYVGCVGSDHGSWDPLAHFESVTGTTPDWPTVLARKRERTLGLLEGHGPMPGVVRALEAVVAAGRKMAVASSSSHAWVDGWLARLGLAGFFDSTHCRDDVEQVKPAPDLFLRAARALGVNPASVLVVEDSRHGMEAAHAAGMTVVAVPNTITTGQDFAGAWRVVPGLGATRFA